MCKTYDWHRAGEIRDKLIKASHTVTVRTYITWDPGAVSCANNLLPGYILQKHSVQYTHTQGQLFLISASFICAPVNSLHNEAVGNMDERHIN